MSTENVKLEAILIVDLKNSIASFIQSFSRKSKVFNTLEFL